MPQRYQWKNYVKNMWGKEDDCVCIDLKECKAVYRFDLGDPADWSSAYGGLSKREMLEKRGLVYDEEITPEEYEKGKEFYNSYK